METKFMWHDLIEEPEDLPNEGEVVLSCIRSFSIDRSKGYIVEEFCVVAYTDGVWLDDRLCEVEDIIAWKYIEPLHD